MKLFSTLALLVALTFTTPVQAEGTKEDKCLNVSMVLLKVGEFRDRGISPDIVFQGLVYNGVPSDVSVKMVDLAYLAMPDVPPVVLARGFYVQCIEALTTY